MLTELNEDIETVWDLGLQNERKVCQHDVVMMRLCMQELERLVVVAIPSLNAPDYRRLRNVWNGSSCGQKLHRTLSKIEYGFV